MRFTIAAGILAHTLTASARSLESGIFWPRSDAQRKHRLQTLNKASHGKALSRLESDNVRQTPTLKRLRTHTNQVLRNRASQKTAEVECDPTASDADVGILSCGLGKYCMEVEDSGLGGLCVEAADVERDLQVSEPAIGDYCDPLSPRYGAYTCDCTNFDVASGTGSFECLFDEEYCVDPAYSICAIVVGAADVAMDGSYVASTCYDFFKPYDQSTCFEYSSTGTCAIDFNGMQCNSCERVDFIGDDDVLENEYTCLEFDCTNTEGMHTGSECTGASPFPIAGYMPDESHSMSMSMSISMSMSMPREPTSAPTSAPTEIHMSMAMNSDSGRRELDALLDSEFGRGKDADTSGAEPQVQPRGEKRVRKRI
jgi:hypothetical protein